MELSDEEIDKEMMRVMECEAESHKGGEAVERFFAGLYKEEWHRIWQEGREAQLTGKNLQNNPYNMKVWNAIWGYGWNNYYPEGM